jgi:hypothetical protein
MRTNLRKKNVVVCCLFLFLVGLTGTVIGKEQASVLSRVQTVDDRELGELIRVALENLPESRRLAKIHPNSKDYEEQKEAVETAKLETVRLVTEAYAAIKLLDSQVEQTNAKLHSSGLPESLARELILAKAELESQRETRLAQLREVMRIIPRHVLGRKPVNQLNGWLKLDVIGDQVCMFNCSKPFQEYAYNMRHHFVKLASEAEAIAYAVDFMTKKDHLPVRVDISRNINGIKVSEELQKKLINSIKTLNLEMEAEVHLDEGMRVEPGETKLYMEQGIISTSFRSRRIAGNRIVRELNNPIDPNDLNTYFRGWIVGRPGQLPVRIRIEHDQESMDLVLRAVEAMKETVKELGVEKFVEIAHEQVSPDEPK